MKVMILAGGRGTRLAEETSLIPKPMVEVGGYPILWHIMRHYAHHGFREFVLTLGYKSHVIKHFIVNYRTMNRSLSVDLGAGSTIVHDDEVVVDWQVDCIETGLDTATGGRVRRALPFTGGQPFMLTYGDGVSDIDLGRLLEFHRGHGKLATVTIVRPVSLFGYMKLDGARVTEFLEKRQQLDDWISGGFFVCEPGIAEYLKDDAEPWERGPLERLAAAGELMAYSHEGFWQCMDSLRDKQLLEQLWHDGKAPWWN
ncbi:MAG: glucose-1-phosphate cytidylyltransferase [Actinobacteria bacterium]|nr:glucose-1-phosphate cytidylyltransferase [Actinomycetota bacterium]